MPPKETPLPRPNGKDEKQAPVPPRASNSALIPFVSRQWKHIQLPIGRPLRLSQQPSSQPQQSVGIPSTELRQREQRIREHAARHLKFDYKNFCLNELIKLRSFRTLDNNTSVRQLIAAAEQAQSSNATPNNSTTSNARIFSM